MRQTIEVTVLSTAEATVAEVKGTTLHETNRGDLVATGYAKKHPNDTHDSEVGHALAMARALKDLAEVYEKRAWDRINNPWKHVGYATGGILEPGKYEIKTSGTTFDHEWLDRVFGKGKGVSVS